MDLRSVSSPTVESGLDKIDASQAVPNLRDASAFAGSTRTASLSSAKIQPRFSEMLDRFAGAPLGPSAKEQSAGVLRENSREREDRFRDRLDLNSNGELRSQGNGSLIEGETSELKKKFTEFVGQTLFGSMLASMRKTLGKPAYMHGGRTEEVFQQQLDQVIVEDLTEASADSIASPMFDLFKMQKRS